MTPVQQALFETAKLFLLWISVAAGLVFVIFAGYPGYAAAATAIVIFTYCAVGVYKIKLQQITDRRELGKYHR